MTLLSCTSSATEENQQQEEDTNPRITETSTASSHEKRRTATVHICRRRETESRSYLETKKSEVLGRARVCTQWQQRKETALHEVNKTESCFFLFP